MPASCGYFICITNIIIFLIILREFVRYFIRPRGYISPVKWGGKNPAQGYGLSFLVCGTDQNSWAEIVEVTDPRNFCRSDRTKRKS